MNVLKADFRTTGRYGAAEFLPESLYLRSTERFWNENAEKTSLQVVLRSSADFHNFLLIHYSADFFKLSNSLFSYLGRTAFCGAQRGVLFRVNCSFNISQFGFVSSDASRRPTAPVASGVTCLEGAQHILYFSV